MNTAVSACAVMPPSIIWLLFLYVGLVGLILGLALALLVWYIDRCLQALVARWRHRAYEEVVLAQLEQQKAIDAEIDEHLDCSACWEDRHPGMCYPLIAGSLCRDHANRRVLEKASSVYVNQQQPINHLVNKTLTGEERCA